MIDNDSIEFKEDEVGERPINTSGPREALFFNKDEASHEHRMKKMQLGLFGFLGDEISSPRNIALIFMIITAGFVCWFSYMSENAKPDTAEFWHSAEHDAWTAMASALAYIFGRGTSSK